MFVGKTVTLRSSNTGSLKPAFQTILGRNPVVQRNICVFFATDQRDFGQVTSGSFELLGNYFEGSLFLHRVSSRMKNVDKVETKCHPK